MQAATKPLTPRKAVLFGTLVVNLPVIAIMIGGILLGFRLVKSWQSLVASFLAVALAWLYWSLVTPRWRVWAFRSGADPERTQALAVKAGLTWPKGVVFERTEIRTPPAMTLYAATGNKGKLAEFATSASTAGINVLALPNLATIPEPVEDAATFTGNAEIKAIAFSLTAPGQLVFADDSGLEIDALGGDPGVRSARFAADLNFEPDSTESSACGKENIDARNNRCVLALLHELPQAPRSARFVCTLALARDGKVLLRAEGTVEGLILDTPQGTNGFGYDPLFLIPHLGLTMAELPRDQKWQLSHRGNAFRALLAQLPSLSS